MVVVDRKPDAVAAPKFWLTPFRAAEFSAIGGVAADLASSWGCSEGNPLLRSADGRFGAKGAALKVGITGGAILAAHLLHRKHPKLERPLTILLGVSGGYLSAVAIRNRSVGCY